MSVWRNSNLSPRWGACSSGEPVSRWSRQSTRWPSPSRCSQRWEPRKPAPPVTTQVVIGPMLLRADDGSAITSHPTCGNHGGARVPDAAMSTDQIRVASVPADHPYVRHLRPPGGDLVERLPDEREPGRRGWWPPRMLETTWVRDHAD